MYNPLVANSPHGGHSLVVTFNCEHLTDHTTNSAVISAAEMFWSNHDVIRYRRGDFAGKESAQT